MDEVTWGPFNDPEWKHAKGQVRVTFDGDRPTGKINDDLEQISGLRIHIYPSGERKAMR